MSEKKIALAAVIGIPLGVVVALPLLKGEFSIEMYFQPKVIIGIILAIAFVILVPVEEPEN